MLEPVGSRHNSCTGVSMQMDMRDDHRNDRYINGRTALGKCSELVTGQEHRSVDMF